MTSMNFIGLDIHKKTISYCVKDISGKVLSEAKIPATRQGLQEWVGTLLKPWANDYLRPYAAAVKVAHPLMLRAIAVAKKKNDRIRTLRSRKLLVRQNVQLKNKIAQLLMESGVSYNKEKLHQQGYFHKVLPTNPEIDPSLWPLLKLAREMIERTQKTERALLRSLEADPLLAAQVERLMTIPAIGHVTALTWVLEVGEIERFHSVKQVISYCGLCSGEKTPAATFQAHAHLQATQSTLADGAIGSRAFGSQTRPGAGRSLRARSRAEQSRPGCDRRRPQAGSVPAGHRSGRT